MRSPRERDRRILSRGRKPTLQWRRSRRDTSLRVSASGIMRDIRLITSAPRVTGSACARMASQAGASSGRGMRSAAAMTAARVSWSGFPHQHLGAQALAVAALTRHRPIPRRDPRRPQPRVTAGTAHHSRAHAGAADVGRAQHGVHPLQERHGSGAGSTQCRDLVRDPPPRASTCPTPASTALSPFAPAS